MNNKLTVYQKPTCSTCRAVVKMLKDRGVDFEAINYYEIPFTEADLRGLLQKLALTPQDILRKNEPIARELGIGKKDLSDDQLLAFMVKHPDVIQRPIAIRGDQAVLARPPEKIEKLL